MFCCTISLFFLFPISLSLNDIRSSSWTGWTAALVALHLVLQVHLATLGQNQTCHHTQTILKCLLPSPSLSLPTHWSSAVVYRQYIFSSTRSQPSSVRAANTLIRRSGDEIPSAAATSVFGLAARTPLVFFLFLFCLNRCSFVFFLVEDVVVVVILTISLYISL